MYVKIFDSILNSSIWAESLATRIVWFTLLTLSNKDGYVRAVPSRLAKLANVSARDCNKALEVLLAPDPVGRPDKWQGRRIKTVPGGWLILKYTEYSQLRDEEQRREQWRTAAQRYRAKKKKKADAARARVSQPMMTRHQKSSRHQKSAHADTDVPATKSLKPSASRPKKLTSPTNGADQPLSEAHALSALSAAVETHNADGRTSTFIRPEAVAALGDENVVKAFAAAGGSREFLSEDPTSRKWFGINFKKALRELRQNL